MTRREVAIIALVGLVLTTVYLFRRQEKRASVAEKSTSATTSSSTIATTEDPVAASAPSFAPTPAAPTTRFTAKWGSRRGELGRNHPQEGNPEGPMSFASTRDGLVVVVDQVNGRLVRYDKNGQIRGTQTIADTVQDIAVAKDGTVAMLDRLGEKNVTLTDSNGKPVGKFPLSGDTGLLTGVFVDGNTVYVEESHGELDAVGTTDGQPMTSPTSLGGRPTKDGALLVTGTLSPSDGRLSVNAIDRATGTSRYARQIQMPRPSIVIVLLDSDDRGVVYAGVAAGSPEVANIACLDPTDGHVIGRVTAPMSSEPEESFRDFSVDGDGTITYALRTAEGVDYGTTHCP